MVHFAQIEDVMMRLSATARKAAVARQAGTGYARSSLRSLQGEGMPALKYYMETMGCQMNVADSERMEGQLSDLGYVCNDRRCLPETERREISGGREHLWVTRKRSSQSYGRVLLRRLAAWQFNTRGRYARKNKKCV